MNDSSARFTRLSRAVCLLVVEGFALGLTLAHLSLGPLLVRYMTTNDVSRDAVHRVFLFLGLGLVTVPTLGALLARRPSVTLDRVAAWFLPVLVLPGALLLVQHRAWVHHPVAFLLTTLAFSLLCAALSNTRAFGGPERFDRFRPLFERAERHRVPLLLVASGSAVYAVYFAFITMRAHWDGYTSTFDLGIYDNVFWNTVHFSSPLFKCSPLRGPQGGHFGIHATFFLFVLAPIYAVFSRPETLLVLQALIIGSGAIPLFLFARRRIGSWRATVVALGYLLYAPLHGANLYHFHFLAISPAFVLWLAYALQEEKRVLLAVSLACALSVREDIGFGVAALGAYFFLSGERPKTGLFVAVTGLVFTLVIKMLVMPNEGGGESFVYMYAGIHPPSDPSLGGVAKTVLGNPGYLLQTLLSPERFTYVLLIFVPLLFLPFKKPMTWLLFAPGFAFTLLMGRSSVGNSLAPVMISFQYTAQWTPYVFLATVIALESLDRKESALVDGIRADAQATPEGRRHSRAALVGFAVALLLTSNQFGAVFQHDTAMAGFIPFHFRTSPQELANRETRRRILSLIPEGVPVAASDCLVPHVSGRPNAYNFAGGNPFDARYVVSEFNMPCAPHSAPVARLLQSKEFGLIALEKPYVLLERGAPTDRNHEFFDALRRPQFPSPQQSSSSPQSSSPQHAP